MGFRIDLGGTIDDAQTTLPWSSALFVATRDAAYAKASKACWITSISSIFFGGFLKLDPQVTIVGSIQNWSNDLEYHFRTPPNGPQIFLTNNRRAEFKAWSNEVCNFGMLCWAVSEVGMPSLLCSTWTYFVVCTHCKTFYSWCMSELGDTHPTSSFRSLGGTQSFRTPNSVAVDRPVQEHPKLCAVDENLLLRIPRGSTAYLTWALSSCGYTNDLGVALGGTLKKTDSHVKNDGNKGYLPPVLCRQALIRSKTKPKR